MPRAEPFKMKKFQQVESRVGTMSDCASIRPSTAVSRKTEKSCMNDVAFGRSTVK